MLFNAFLTLFGAFFIPLLDQFRFLDGVSLNLDGGIECAGHIAYFKRNIAFRLVTPEYLVEAFFGLKYPVAQIIERTYLVKLVYTHRSVAVALANGTGDGLLNLIWAVWLVDHINVSGMHLQVNTDAHFRTAADKHLYVTGVIRIHYFCQFGSGQRAFDDIACFWVDIFLPIDKCHLFCGQTTICHNTFTQLSMCGTTCGKLQPIQKYQLSGSQVGFCLFGHQFYGRGNFGIFSTVFTIHQCALPQYLTFYGRGIEA